MNCSVPTLSSIAATNPPLAYEIKYSPVLWEHQPHFEDSEATGGQLLLHQIVHILDSEGTSAHLPGKTGPYSGP